MPITINYRDFPGVNYTSITTDKNWMKNAMWTILYLPMDFIIIVSWCGLVLTFLFIIGICIIPIFFTAFLSMNRKVKRKYDVIQFTEEEEEELVSIPEIGNAEKKEL